MIEVLSRSGLSKTTVWTSGSGKIRTPNLLVLSSASSPAPGYAQLLLDEEIGAIRSPTDPDFQTIDLPASIYVPFSARSRQEKEDSCGSVEAEVDDPIIPNEQWLTSDLTIVPNAFELRRDARTFVRSVARLRKQVGYCKLLYAPGMMDVSNIALLTYMGIDLFDTSLLAYRSSRGIISRAEGAFAPDNAKWALQQGESILDLNLRGCSLADAVAANWLLRDSGFKVGFHVMPNLPGANLADDEGMFRALFSDERLRPDFLKIYPTLVTPG